VKRGSLLLVAGLVALASVASGCGGGGDSSTTSSSTVAGASGASGEQGPTSAAVDVTFASPSGNQANATGAYLLKANRLPYLMNSLAQAFEVPDEITVRGVNGFGGGPFYSPQNNTITFQYGFANLVFQTMKQLNPQYNDYRLGTAVGAVDSFILAHEFTHALIAIYDLPVLGKEEDAADELATLILLKAPQGGKYVFDAAQFWYALSKQQRVPSVSDYADVHSLDLQRAYAMICDLAGSSKDAYQQVAQLKLLPPARLQGCPAEYQQHVDSFEQVLGDHLQGSLAAG
jgi:hypothetical protein